MDEDLVDSIANRLENKLRAGWRQAMREIKDSNNLADLEASIASQDTAGIIEGIDEAVDAFATDVAAGYVYAGQRAARAIDEVSDTAFRFDLVDDAAIDWMKTQAEDIAADLIYEQQAVAQRVITLATRRGLSPRGIAEEVQSSIGLTVAQVDQVERYRSVLEAGDYQRALGYELADGRYDAALRRADDAGTFLGETRIDQMVGRYRDNWVRFRADNVALQTSQEATHAGIDDAHEQAVEQEVIEAESVTRTWFTMDDPKVRPSHRPMHGDVQPLGTPFRSGNGVDLMFPGDPNAPADETAGCRCRVVTNVARSRKRLDLAA